MQVFNRWAQLVRKPGLVQILGHHAIDVPPLGTQPPYANTRAGIRLLVQPLAGADLPWTIDITSTQVKAMLEGFLATGRHVGLRLGWRSRGYGVLRKDTISLSPMNRAE